MNRSQHKLEALLLNQGSPLGAKAFVQVPGGTQAGKCPQLDFAAAAGATKGQCALKQLLAHSGTAHRF